jgi:CHASE2 domain-containing sensor protein
MTRARHRGWKSYAEVGLVVLAVSLAVHFLQHGLWLTGFETSALDSFLILRAEPRRSEDVVLVEIDEEAYQTDFHSTSPLDPMSLSRLLDAVAMGGAQVIGVDLDTSDSRFKALNPARWPHAVWARAAEIDSDGKAVALGVLGGQEAPGVRSGIAAAPLDTDCRVRRFRRAFEQPGGGRAVPSFAQAMVAASGRGRSGEPEKEIELNFFGDRYTFATYHARDVIQGAQLPGWRRQQPFSGRIVLLGGTYKAARDSYFTALGEDGRRKSGLEIVADMVQSVIDRRGIRPANKLLMVIVEVLSSLLIVFINHRAQHKKEIGKALVWSLTITFVAAPLGSLLAFSTLAYWANFVPILVGVTIHQLYDQAKHYRDLLHESAA